MWVRPVPGLGLIAAQFVFGAFAGVPAAESIGTGAARLREFVFLASGVRPAEGVLTGSPATATAKRRPALLAYSTRRSRSPARTSPTQSAFSMTYRSRSEAYSAARAIFSRS